MNESKLDLKPIFARHETFHPRYGWLKKGYDRVRERPDLFSQKDAVVLLGVGKNMVKAIRYWGVAFKILKEKQGKGNKNSYKVSSIGKKIFAEDGWDPYLEDPGSLWILHWNLFKNPCYVPVWYCAFNEFNLHTFKTDDLLFAIKDFKKRNFPASRASDSSISKDINCLLRMYVERKDTQPLKEDTLDCPFTELGIISNYSDSRRYAFNFGSKSSLPNDIIVATCLEYSQKIESSAKSISVSRLSYDPGSPGQIFKLTESAICEAIEKISAEITEISLSETAGVIQFVYSKDPVHLSLEILERHYNKGN